MIVFAKDGIINSVQTEVQAQAYINNGWKRVETAETVKPNPAVFGEEKPSTVEGETVMPTRIKRKRTPKG